MQRIGCHLLTCVPWIKENGRLLSKWSVLCSHFCEDDVVLTDARFHWDLQCDVPRRLILFGIVFGLDAGQPARLPVHRRPVGSKNKGVHRLVVEFDCHTNGTRFSSSADRQADVPSSPDDQFFHRQLVFVRVMDS